MMGSAGSTMTRRHARYVPLALLLAFVVCNAGAQAATGAAACGKKGVVCRQVTVPLDWSGKRPGKVALHVERLPAEGTPQGVLFMLAGGPGQPSAQAFSLGSYQAVWHLFFPGYTLVAFDYRGTGRSGALTCPGLRTSSDPSPAGVARCARLLGPRRDYYRTADNVRDIEAVRQALGYGRIAVFGVSYGTKVALEYARAYPDRVERLLLDSVLSPDRNDPFETDVLGSLPSKLRTFCSAGDCRGTASRYVSDVIAVGNALATKPLVGRVLQPSGSRRLQTLTAKRFVALVVETDLDLGLAVELPAAVHAARRGQPLALLRLAQLFARRPVPVRPAVYLATACGDGPFPWQSSTPISQRPALLKKALAAVPKGAFGGFGTWAYELGNASDCIDWPAATPAAATPAAYPNVPVLALSGDDDIRTPDSEARSVLAKFPKGHLLRVANVGHSVLSSSLTPCVIHAVNDWLDGSHVASTCHSPRLLAPLTKLPAEGPAQTVPATPGQDAEIVRETVHEAEAGWLLTLAQGLDPDGAHAITLSGLDSGTLVAKGSAFTLSGYGLAGGITLNGVLQVSLDFGQGLTFRGNLTVRGRNVTIGVLNVNGPVVTGTIDGKPFRA
jgi:pimeloyl-ACP methyl ester carboxylesterase